MLNQKILNERAIAMANWAKKAQEESNALMEAECEKLSNEVISSFSIFDPSSWLEAKDTTSLRARCKNNMDRAWVIVLVDGMINKLLLSQTEADQEAASLKFLNFVNDQEKKLPISYQQWIEYERGLSSEVRTELGDTESAFNKNNAFSLSKYTPYALAIGMAGVGWYATSLVLSEKESRRENPLPLIAAGMGLLKGAAAIAALGIGGGLLSAGTVSLFDKPQLASAFVGLDGAVEKAKQLAESGKYQGTQNKIAFFSTIGFSNSMRICALTADDARKQTLFMLYACAYATGDAKYINKANEYIGGWFSSPKGFTDFNSAEAEMKSVLNMMQQDSNQLVRDMTYDFAVISSAACMAETDRSLRVQEGLGENPCKGLSFFDTAWQVLDGLFFGGERPCLYTKEKWRKTKILVYVPMGLVGSFYLAPVIKPIFSIVGSGLSMGADALKERAEKKKAKQAQSNPFKYARLQKNPRRRLR